MRTYTRRRPVHKIIENVHEFCRLCLQNTKDVETVALFTSENNNLYPPLTTKIMICIGLELANEECLPNIICTECNDKINNFYTFRKKCGIAYQTFKSHSLASKETIANCTSQVATQNENEEIVIATGCLNDNEEIVIATSCLEDKQLRISSSAEIPNCNSNVIENGIQDELSSLLDLPEISKFLKTVLLEIGIIRNNGENSLHSDFLGNTIELETGDGCQITLQLSEAGNEETNITREEPVTGHMSSSSIQDPASSIEDAHERKNGRAVCRVCGKAFVSRGVLRRHARTHSGERPYACRACPRRFAQREVLRRHELVHLEQRPFACDLCPKSFTQRGALTTHRRSHAPPAARPFALHRCHLCPKFFLHASGLSRHMRAHSVQPQVSCDVCGRTFRDRDGIQRHVRRAHANNKPSKLEDSTKTTHTISNATVKIEYEPNLITT